MNKKLLRRFIGLILTALLLVGVFVIAATTAARGSILEGVVGSTRSPPTQTVNAFSFVGIG
jgi:hypothetical protein